MGYLFSFTLVFLSWTLLPSTRSEAQAIKPYHLLDLLIRDYSFKSFNTSLPTGSPFSIKLPSNFSDIKVKTARFRCGSLRRYGARFEEFRLGIGVNVHPCVERVMIVTQNLGHNWSSIYYQNYDLSGYQLVSPVLGLLAYNAGTDVNSSAPFEVGILALDGQPIEINFRNATIETRVRVQVYSNDSSTKYHSTSPLCASFEKDGKVTLAKQAKPFVCAARRNGHFGLVIEEPTVSSELPNKGVKREKPWKVAVESSVGAALGAFLIGLLLVAMFARVKKRSRMDELERMAYEEEALQVSMVGHIRAPIASGTRTTPTTVENEYIPPRRR